VHDEWKGEEMLNKVILIGRLATDPELKYTPSGVAVTSFRIAVDRRMAPNAAGEKETDFIDIVAWRQQAEFAANYLNKGRLVAVDGRLQIRNWVAQDGTKRRSAEVVANDLRSLERPRDGSGAPSHYEDAPHPAEVGVGAGMGSAQDMDQDFNDPFADQ
jgi:single-strand DNA-binding protein